MKCKVCGKEITEPQYSEPICSHKCFIENFWDEALDDEAIIIEGVCYHDGGYKDPHLYNGFLGCAGRKFVIQMNDGRVTVTNNLWYNGEIPEERKVPDNAKFITESPSSTDGVVVI